jgi:hypothetical protein
MYGNISRTVRRLSCLGGIGPASSRRRRKNEIGTGGNNGGGGNKKSVIKKTKSGKDIIISENDIDDENLHVVSVEDDTATDLEALQYQQNGNLHQQTLCRGVSAVSQAVSDMARDDENDGDIDYTDIRKQRQQQQVREYIDPQQHFIPKRSKSTSRKNRLERIKRLMPYYVDPEDEEDEHGNDCEEQGDSSEAQKVAGGTLIRTNHDNFTKQLSSAQQLAFVQNIGNHTNAKKGDILSRQQSQQQNRHTKTSNDSDSSDIENSNSCASVPIPDNLSQARRSIQVDDIPIPPHDDDPDNNLDMFSMASYTSPLVEVFQRGTGNLRMHVKFDGLKYQLGNKVVLGGVSGEVRPKRMTAVLGPSGAGSKYFFYHILSLFILWVSRCY